MGWASPGKGCRPWQVPLCPLPCELRMAAGSRALGEALHSQPCLRLGTGEFQVLGGELAVWAQVLGWVQGA